MGAIRAWEPARGPFYPFAVHCVYTKTASALAAARARKHEPLSRASSLDYSALGISDDPDIRGAIHSPLLWLEAVPSSIDGQPTAHTDPLSAVLVREQLAAVRAASRTLTDKERAVLGGVLGGKSYRQLASELGGAAGARSVTRATAPGVCSPSQLRRSASAFGLHRRRRRLTRVHAKAELRPIGNDGRSANDTPRLEIGDERVETRLVLARARRHARRERGLRRTRRSRCSSTPNSEDPLLGRARFPRRPRSCAHSARSGWRACRGKKRPRRTGGPYIEPPGLGGMWDACRMPFVPELFCAGARANRGQVAAGRARGGAVLRRFDGRGARCAGRVVRRRARAAPPGARTHQGHAGVRGVRQRR